MDFWFNVAMAYAEGVDDGVQNERIDGDPEFVEKYVADEVDEKGERVRVQRSRYKARPSPSPLSNHVLFANLPACGFASGFRCNGCFFLV